MDEIIKSLIKTVRCHEGIDPNLPISDKLAVEIELRLKGYVAALLGICSPDSVKKDNVNAQLLHIKETAAAHDRDSWFNQMKNEGSSL